VRTEFGVGEQFLTERQVSDRFGISRTTANKALSNLVVDGLLEFRKGVGTFVRPPKPSVNLRRLVSFTEKAIAAGLRPRTEVVTWRVVRASRLRLLPPDEATTVLQIPADAKVYEMARLRSLNDERVIYERRALRVDLCPELGRDDAVGSLYATFHDRGVELDGVAQRIRARNADGSEAAELGVEVGTAVLELTGVGYLGDATPLWFEETIYRGDSYEFVNQLRVSGDDRRSALNARPATGAQEEAHRWYQWE